MEKNKIQIILKSNNSFVQIRNESLLTYKSQIACGIDIDQLKVTWKKRLKLNKTIRVQNWVERGDKKYTFVEDISSNTLRALWCSNMSIEGYWFKGKLKDYEEKHENGKKQRADTIFWQERISNRCKHQYARSNKSDSNDHLLYFSGQTWLQKWWWHCKKAKLRSNREHTCKKNREKVGQ